MDTSLMKEMRSLIIQLEKLVNKPYSTTSSEWVLAPIIVNRTGLSVMAMREYRRCSIWAEGIHWGRNPKGRIIYNINAIDKWMSSNV